MNDEELAEIQKKFVDLLKIGYREFGIVPISSIERIASLYETYHIQFDGEFKTILYEWEYNRECELS